MPNDEDTLAHPEQPRFLLSAWLWAVALFVFFAAIVAISFGTMSRGSAYEQDRAQKRTEKLKTAREDWAKNQSYAWVDKAKGTARIPIERAMEIELVELQAKKPVPAGPIATPASAEAPATAPGAGQPANPPNAAPGAQPGASTTPAARPNSHSESPAVSPSAGPVQHTVGSPIPLRVPAGSPLPPAPGSTASPKPQ